MKAKISAKPDIVRAAAKDRHAGGISLGHLYSTVLA